MKTARNTALVITAAILIGMIGIYYLFPDTSAEFLLKFDRKIGGLKKHHLIVNESRFEYLEGGQGTPLLLLHGFATDKDNWTRLGRFITPHFRVIAPDLPGFGETPPPKDNNYTIPIQARRIKAFVKALGIKRHHLAGSSMGGAIAGAYAATYPADTLSLTLFAPFGVATATSSEMFKQIADGHPMPLIARTDQEYDHLLDFVFVKKPFIPGPVKSLLARKAIEKHPLYQEILTQLAFMKETPLEDLLIGLPVPTLIIWGDQDRVLHVSGAKILAPMIPNATSRIIPNVGHLPMLEQPKETANIYLSFLRHNGFLVK